jgi:hypothetical protein
MMPQGLFGSFQFKSLDIVQDLDIRASHFNLKTSAEPEDSDPRVAGFATGPEDPVFNAGIK